MTAPVVLAQVPSCDGLTWEVHRRPREGKRVLWSSHGIHVESGRRLAEVVIGRADGPSSPQELITTVTDGLNGHRKSLHALVLILQQLDAEASRLRAMVTESGVGPAIRANEAEFAAMTAHRIVRELGVFDA